MFMNYTSQSIPVSRLWTIKFSNKQLYKMFDFLYAKEATIQTIQILNSEENY